MEENHRLSDAVKADDSGHRPTKETAEIRVYSYDAPDIGAMFAVEKALNNYGTSVYLLEYLLSKVPYVEFLTTTESVWTYYTNMNENPKDKKEDAVDYKNRSGTYRGNICRDQ